MYTHFCERIDIRSAQVSAQLNPHNWRSFDLEVSSDVVWSAQRIIFDVPNLFTSQFIFSTYLEILTSTFKKVFIAKQNVIQYGISLWSVGVSCAGCVPSHLLVHSQLTCWASSVRNRRFWCCVITASATAEVSRYYQHYFCHKCKT